MFYSKKITAFAILISLFLAAYSDSASDIKYPFIVCKPAIPIAEKDSVSLQLMLGMAVNECRAPTYKYPAIPFKIEISPLTIYPPIFSIYVKYTEIPVPPDKICPDVYNPVNYGPEFNFGVLNEGHYNVIDNEKTVGSFKVVKKSDISSYTIKGVIVDDPFPLKRMGFPIFDVNIIVKRKLNTITDKPVSPNSEIPVCSTSTGTDGKFIIKNLSADSYSLYFSHKEFNNTSLSINLVSDTSISVIMLARNAAATISGNVTEINSSITDIVGKPIEGCTVHVTLPLLIYPISDNSSESEPSPVGLKTVTDKNGAYTIPKIPIRYNGEKWQVKAYKSGYNTSSINVELYNLQNKVVNFRLETLFTNTHSDTLNGIIFTMATNKSIYQTNEGLNARYSIYNTTKTTVKYFPFAQNCVYDMIVKDTTGKVLFRLSDVIDCLETETPVALEVKPGETVMKTFPIYYFPKFTSSMVNNQKFLKLIISGRLMGEKYDKTEVSVPVNVQIPTTQAQPLQNEIQISEVACSSNHGRIHLLLPVNNTVSLIVYSLDGKIRHDLSIKKELPAGLHTFSFNSWSTSGGVFIVKVATSVYSKAFKVFTSNVSATF